MQATVRIYFQKAPAKRTKDNLCPVRLCVTHDRMRKYYAITDQLKKDELQFLSEDYIAKVTGDHPRGIYLEIVSEYERIVEDAKNIIRDIPDFSFNQFEERYFHKVVKWDNFFQAAWSHAQQLRSEGRYGYASSFECTIKAVKEFHENKTFTFTPADKISTRKDAYLDGKSLRFVDISESWLKRFEQHMQKNNLSCSTHGIYIRNIRVLFNIAIKKHKIRAPYPFTDYTPKNPTGRKLAFTAHQISLIANYKPCDPQVKYYRDIFLFSFLANGMNIADIARLKTSNIFDGEILFIREKTKNKKQGQQEIHVPITTHLQFIIDTQGNRSIGHDAFIFPILKKEWTDEKCFMHLRGFISMMNKHLKQIAGKVGITENISSYTARHSWATISKNSAGATIEFIKESLGHSNVSVTENYLKQFEKSTRVEHSEKVERVIFNKVI